MRYEYSPKPDPVEKKLDRVIELLEQLVCATYPPIQYSPAPLPPTYTGDPPGWWQQGPIAGEGGMVEE